MDKTAVHTQYGEDLVDADIDYILTYCPDIEVLQLTMTPQEILDLACKRDAEAAEYLWRAA
jgi:hypothetical protein